MSAITVFSFDEIERMAEVMAKSKLFGIQTPEQYLTLMFLAQAEGQHPATVAQDYDLIQGRPARKTHSVLARFQAAGGKIQWDMFSETAVSGTFSHPSGGNLQVVWTIEMAQRAGLAGKENWKKTPRAMLRARCIAEGVRAVYPAALGGQLLVEEAADLVLGAEAEAKDMGMAEVVSNERPALPPYSDADFEKNIDSWRKVIESGRKTAQDLLSMLSTKAVFSDEQRGTILALATKALAATDSDGESL